MTPGAFPPTILIRASLHGYSRRTLKRQMTGALFTALRIGRNSSTAGASRS
jgi:hypothetical protein